MAVIMALDVGGKKTGAALSDSMEILAYPLTVFHYAKLDELSIQVRDVIRKHGVNKIVVGIPYGNDGEMTAQAHNIIRTVKFLQRRINAGIQWDYQEEILSSRESLEMLIDGGASKKKRRQPLDKYAAVQILQRYLKKHEVK